MESSNYFINKKIDKKIKELQKLLIDYANSLKKYENLSGKEYNFFLKFSVVRNGRKKKLAEIERKMEI